MTKILYANGDSFTAGAELALEMILPSEKANLRYGLSVNPLTDKVRNRHNDELAKITKPITSVEDDHPYTVECRNRAWPHKLAKAINYDVAINSAKPGEGNGYISYTTIEDISQLLENHSAENIFAVIMLTGIDRICIPFYNRTVTVMLGWDTEDELMSQFRELYLEHSSDEFLFYKSVNNVLALENFLTKNKVKHCFVDSVLFQAAMAEYYQSHKVIANTLPQIKYSMWDILSKNPEKQYMLYGGHFSEEVHEIFANQIANDFIAGKL